MRRRGFKRGLALIALAAASVAAGCGDDGASEEQARETTAEFLRAFASIDPAQCTWLSTNSQDQVVLSATGAAADGDSCVEVISAARETLSGTSTPELLNADALRAAADNVDAAEFAVRGGSARLTFPADEDGSSEGPSYVALVLEDGGWRVDDLDAGSG